MRNLILFSALTICVISFSGCGNSSERTVFVGHGWGGWHFWGGHR